MDFTTLIFLQMHYILVIFEDHNSQYNEDSSILGYYTTVTSGQLPIFHRSTVHSKYRKLHSHLPLCNPCPNKSYFHPMTSENRHSNLWTPPAQSNVLKPTTRSELCRYINRAKWTSHHARTLKMEMEYLPGMIVCLNHMM
jgi:hypothetical protein